MQWKLLLLSTITLLSIFSCTDEPIQTTTTNEGTLKSCCCKNDYVEIETNDYKFTIPNVITPNQDGNNDMFTISFGNGIDSIMSLEVFNDNNDLIASISSSKVNSFSSVLWDGTNMNSEISAGIYSYVLKLKSTNLEEIVIDEDICLQAEAQMSPICVDNAENCVYPIQLSPTGFDPTIDPNEICIP